MVKYLRQLASESLVYGLAGIIGRFISIFLVPIYTRIFTPEDYGVISLVGTTMALATIFIVLALDNSAHRWYWDTESIEDRKSTLASWAWCQSAVSLIFALLVYVEADWLGRIIVGRADAGVYFRLTALTLPLTVLGSVTTNWLRMQRRPWATMGFALGSSLITILLTIMFVVVLRWGVQGVYVAQLITAGAATVAAAMLMQDWISPFRFQLSRLSEMLRFALPLIPAGLAFWVVNFAGRYFVQLYATTGEVGLYQVGSSLAALVALVTGAFQQAWGPFAFSIHKRAEARQVYADVFLAYVWLTSAISVALALFAPEALRLIATDQYLGASTVVGILAFSYTMIGLGYIASVGLGIVKTTGPTGLAITIAAVVNIGLNVLLVPLWGKVGSAFATLLSQSVVPVYLFYRAQQVYYIPFRFGAALSILAISLGLILAGTWWPIERLWLSAATKLMLLALFVPLLFVLRLFTPAQARRLLNVPRWFPSRQCCL